MPLYYGCGKHLADRPASKQVDCPYCPAPRHTSWPGISREDYEKIQPFVAAELKRRSKEPPPGTHRYLLTVWDRQLERERKYQIDAYSAADAITQAEMKFRRHCLMRAQDGTMKPCQYVTGIAPASPHLCDVPVLK